MNLTEQIKQKALDTGFDLVGITSADPIPQPHIESLKAFLRRQRHGQMLYLARNFEKRTNPQKLLPSAASVICLALNYTPQTNLQQGTDAPKELLGRVAFYAQYSDYHPFLKHKLFKLASFITSVTGPKHKFKFCVDSVPIAERSLAQRAGLGFIGKSHMLINPTLGPNLLLAEIVTTLKLTPDKPLQSQCTDCRECISACPTGALAPDGSFDARKCISYLTIEHKDNIPPDLAPKITNHLFGCDECVLACPFFQTAQPRKNKQFKHYPERAYLDLQQVLNMTEQQFENKFADSPFTRPGLDRLKRNAQICLTNITRWSSPCP